MSRCYRCRCGCWDWGRFCRSSHQSHRQSGAVRLGFGVGLFQVPRIFGRGIFVDMIKALTLAWSERLPLSHSYPSWRMPVGDRDLLALRAHHWRVSIRGTLAWARERRILSGRIPGRRMRKGAPQLVGHREIRAGGSSFCLRRTRTKERPRGGILSSPFAGFAQYSVFVVNGDELAKLLAPEPIAFGFRKVGVSNQKCIAIPRDGTLEQFLVGLERHVARIGGGGL